MVLTNLLLTTHNLSKRPSSKACSITFTGPISSDREGLSPMPVTWATTLAPTELKKEAALEPISAKSTSTPFSDQPFISASSLLNRLMFKPPQRPRSVDTTRYPTQGDQSLHEWFLHKDGWPPYVPAFYAFWRRRPFPSL